MIFDPFASSYLHCRVAGCPNLRHGASAFCPAHRRRKARAGLPLRAPVAARRAQGGRLGGHYLLSTVLRRLT
jgi:hypothetical protein